MTVREWAAEFFAAHPPGKASSSARREIAWRVHVEPRFGRIPISAVAPSDVQIWVTELVALRSVSTARQALGVLRQILDVATADGVLTRNPASGARLPRAPRSEPCPLTHDQLWSLSAAMTSERDRLMVLVMGYGGLRWGEVSALRVRSVDSKQSTSSGGVCRGQWAAVPRCREDSRISNGAAPSTDCGRPACMVQITRTG
ncbi:tyrosine-type recombinase/integrase [Rhodococcus erythropolis]